MNLRCELFFPPELVGELKNLRDVEWQRLVERVAGYPESHPDRLALTLVVIQLAGCLSCGPGSFRHLKGCISCARQAINAFKGGDAELVKMFEKAREDVLKFLGEQEKQIAA